MESPLTSSTGTDPEPSRRAGEPPTRRRAWVTIGALIGIFAIVIGATLAASPIVAPTSQHSLTIVSDPGVQISAGVANGLVFGFQPAASPASDDPRVPAIAQATLVGSVAATSCGAASGCPSAIIVVVTNDQLSHLQASGMSSSVWCYQAGSDCAATSGAQFTVDVTQYTSVPLNLVVWVPGGAPGTFSVSATLDWQTA